MTDPQFAIVTARNALEQALSGISDQMRDYPTPISGCDAQYNHLIAERGRVRAALAALGRTPFVATPRTPHPGAGIESR